MLRKLSSCLIICIVVLLCSSSALAGLHFWEVSFALKKNADSARIIADDIARLSNRVASLSTDIEKISNTIGSTRQKGKIIVLEDLIDLFSKKVNELERATNRLRELTNTMQSQSNRIKQVTLKSHKRKKCPPNKHWVPGHYNKKGYWKKGHCVWN